MDIDSKFGEAEIYKSMGLLEESLAIYEQILGTVPDLNPSSQESIREKIDQLKGEIASLEKIDCSEIPDQDIALVKELLANPEDEQAILYSASCFKELGLYKEALADYEKLLGLNYPWENLISDMAECLLKIHIPSECIEKVEDIVEHRGLPEKDKGRFKFRLGMEIEKRDQRSLAIDFYRSAQKNDPENNEVKLRLDSATSGTLYGSRYDYLIEHKMVTAHQLQQALVLSKNTKKSVEFILLEYFKIKKEDLAESLSIFYGCPFKAYDPELPTPSELIGNLKKAFLLNEVWVPLSREDDSVEVFIDDPRDLIRTDHIRSLLKAKRIDFSVGIKEDIEAFIKRFFDEKNIDSSSPRKEVPDEFDLIRDISFDVEEETQDEEESVDQESSQVVRLVDQILITAHRKNVSDIHVEPFPDGQFTNIRFRLDGVCHDYLKVPNIMAKGILSRLKVMAGLDIAEKRLPQDGKIKFRRKGLPPLELRLVTLPTAGGFEDAVLRILSKADAINLEELSLGDRNLNIMKKIISQPYGLVLVVGPTGSGKTTTLHSALGYINKPGIKIWAAEDPVEITQRGLRQVEARPGIGLDFSKIMRAFLRADPDVIMIGEMRDRETASIAVEASLTGHLVFSTLHTNSSSETVTRLLDMGLNPINFSDAFLGVLAQRLVRRLCEDCREAFHPSREEFEEIASEYGDDSNEDTGMEFEPDITLYRPVGCEACFGTGYKGRIAIHELMEGTPEIKRLIRKHESSVSLCEKAKTQGMMTLKQDGILKGFQGLTSISEVRRVCMN